MPNRLTPNLTPAPLNFAILTYNALEYTKICLESIKRNTKIAHNIFVLDNGSTDGSRDWLASVAAPNFYTENASKNSGVPGGRNRLIEIISPHLPADGFIVFLDNDMELKPGWDEDYTAFFQEHPEVGIASAFGHRMVVHQSYRELLPAPAYTAPVDVACGGFACWIRASTIKAVGGFDENLGLFWHEDDDYSLRAIAAGFDVYALPHAKVIHHEHKSGAATPGIKVDGSPKNQAYLCHKWRTMGIIDEHGRVQRRRQSVGHFSNSATNYCSQYSLDQGGYRWLPKQASFICAPSASAASANVLVHNFSLRCAKAEWYDLFPLQVSINVQQGANLQLTFENSEQEHKICLTASPGARIDFCSESAFIPALRGLGAQAGRAVSVQAFGLPEWLRPLTASQQMSTSWAWVSSILDCDGDAELSQSLLADLAPTLPELELHPYCLNERTIEETSKISAALEPYRTLCSRITASPENAIVVGEPLNWFGQSRYRELRERGLGNKRLIALLPRVSASPTQATLAALAECTEVWLLNSTDRDRLVSAGLHEQRAKLIPLGVNSSIFNRPSTTAPTSLIAGRACILARVVSADDPFLRTAIAAYLGAFKAEDPVCLLLTIAPHGAALPPQMLAGLIGAQSIDPATCPPVVTVNLTGEPSYRAALYKGCACFLTTACDDRKFDFIEAAACGVPVLNVSPRTEECSLLATSSAGMAQLSLSSVFPASTQNSLSALDCLKPSLINACTRALRGFIENQTAALAQAHDYAMQIQQHYDAAATVAYIKTRIKSL